jgi:hypothetical protein
MQHCPCAVIYKWLRSHQIRRRSHTWHQTPIAHLASDADPTPGIRRRSHTWHQAPIAHLASGAVRVISLSLTCQMGIGTRTKH